MATIHESLERALRHYQSGELDEAERLCQQILTAEGRHAGALHLCGLVALRRGRPADAIQSISAAIRGDDRQPVYHANLGEAYRAAGQHAAAKDCYRRALELGLQHSALRNNLGLALVALGELAAARGEFAEAVRLQPDYVEALHNLGMALQAEKQYAEAAECHRRVLQLQPAAAGSLGALAVSLQLMGRLEEAVGEYERYLELAPQDAAARMNLATVLHALRRFGDAQAQYERLAAGAAPGIQLLVQMGLCMRSQGKLEKGAECFRQAIALDPQRDEPHFRLGAALLAKGDFAGGWPEYEWRLKRVARYSDLPVWDGRELGGARIVIYSEGGQGLGDTLQFVRYERLVRERGGDVVLDVQPALIRLLSHSGFSQVVAAGAPILPSCEFQAALMSLPRIFGTALDSIPADVPYLCAEPELIAAWAEKLRPYGGFKIGIHWHGSRIAIGDGRVIPLGQFEALARVPGVTLVSLQKQAGLDQIAAVADRFTVVDFGDELDAAHRALVDSAAIMKNLDLVITNDTVIAHLAGALGVPVWVVLLYAAEWRWLTERGDSPWYPSMRLFRQTRLEDWSGVFARMAAELAALVSQRSSR